MTRKAIAKKANSKGVVYALVTDGITYEVWTLCENYSRHVKGGIEKTWRYIKKGLTKEDGEALFNRRAA